MNVRTLIALICLVLLVGFVIFCNAWLDGETKKMVSLLEETSKALREESEDAKTLYGEYRDLYRRDRKWMHFIVHKEHFAEPDVLNDQLDAFFDEGASYDDLASDLEKLKSLVREIYDKSSPIPANLL